MFDGVAVIIKIQKNHTSVSKAQVRKYQKRAYVSIE